MNIIREKIGHDDILMVHSENLDVIEVLSSGRISIHKRFIGKKKYLFIDEAQKFPI